MRSWLQMIRMKEMPINDRPIERLEQYGAQALSNEELLSILIKCGTKKESVKEVAGHVLKSVQKIQELKYLSLSQFTSISGIGKTKAITILAALELGKRVNQKNETIYKRKITNADIVYDFYKDQIGDHLQEHFYCLYLDSQKRVIKQKLIFLGTLDFSIVHPREIFKEAYALSASSIICIHNHPSDQVEPSKQDLSITNQLVEIGNLLGIPVNDHIIIGKKHYYSFFEHNRIRV